jgi:hypothetical protein
MEEKFGTLLMTAGVAGKVAEDTDFSKFVTNSIRRHTSDDWGDIDDTDKRANEEAQKYGARILSVYTANDKPKIWIITEADRSATTVLFPDEY